MILEPKKIKSVTVCIFSPSICHDGHLEGPRAIQGPQQRPALVRRGLALGQHLAGGQSGLVAHPHPPHPFQAHNAQGWLPSRHQAHPLDQSRGVGSQPGWELALCGDQDRTGGTERQITPHSPRSGASGKPSSSPRIFVNPTNP